MEPTPLAPLRTYAATPNFLVYVDVPSPLASKASRLSSGRHSPEKGSEAPSLGNAELAPSVKHTFAMLVAAPPFCRIRNETMLPPNSFARSVRAEPMVPSCVSETQTLREAGIQLGA